MSEDALLSICIALLGVVGLNLLQSRWAVAEVIERAETAGRFFDRVDNLEEIRTQVEESTHIILSGSSISAHLPFLRDTLLNRLNSGATVQILLVSPGSGAAKMAAFRANKTLAQFDTPLRNEIDALSQLDAAKVGGTLEVRKVDYLAPYVYYSYDPSTRRGRAMLRVTTFRGAHDERPTFYVERRNDPFWFEHFYREFTKLWKEGKPAW